MVLSLVGAGPVWIVLAIFMPILGQSGCSCNLFEREMECGGKWVTREMRHLIEERL
jgi:hypothetical protein